MQQSSTKRAPLTFRMIHKFREELGFAKEFVCAPLRVGSICPSSKALAGKLVSMVPLDGDGLIIDLGAGTGCVTAELLRRGVDPDRIVAVERSKGFADAFKKQFPQVTMLTGDACRLNALLAAHKPDYTLCAVISSLPFRVMPPSLVTRIALGMRQMLHRRGGRLVMYSYAWWLRYPLRKFGFAPDAAHVVLQNVPPARVESYAAQSKRRTRQKRLHPAA